MLKPLHSENVSSGRACRLNRLLGGGRARDGIRQVSVPLSGGTRNLRIGFMDTVLKVLILLSSGVGLGMTVQYLVRWLRYHQQAVRLNGGALTWKKDVRQAPEWQAMRKSRLLFFTAFFATLVIVSLLVAVLPLLKH